MLDSGLTLRSSALWSTSLKTGGTKSSSSWRQSVLDVWQSLNDILSTSCQEGSFMEWRILNCEQDCSTQSWQTSSGSRLLAFLTSASSSIEMRLFTITVPSTSWSGTRPFQQRFFFLEKTEEEPSATVWEKGTSAEEEAQRRGEGCSYWQAADLAGNSRKEDAGRNQKAGKDPGHPQQAAAPSRSLLWACWCPQAAYQLHICSAASSCD